MIKNKYPQFKLICKSIGLPEPTEEFKFHPKRKWRIDFAFPDVLLAIEIEGGAWTKYCRHTHSSGYIADMEKYNMLTELGWKLLRYIPQKIDYEQIKIVYNRLKFNNNTKY